MFRVLVIDDEPLTLSLYKKCLASPRVTVDTCESLVEALSLIDQEHCYHLVFSDLRLSGTDRHEGLHLVRYLKKNSPETVVALMTGYGSEDHKTAAVTSGVDYYLEKPVEMATLKKILSDQVGILFPASVQK